MARTVGIGIQNFEEILKQDYFYIDKTPFIKEWWESGDSVTLIARPRRFGKTLNMSMLDRFFSCEFAGKGDIFENLSIWNEKEYRELQGTYPVINLTFAFIKETDYESTCKRMLEVLMEQFKKYAYVADSDKLSQIDKDYIRKMAIDMTPFEAGTCLRRLSECLYHYYDKKVIILLDEYDTPMQEAYMHGFWDELVEFTRSIFNATFKTNPWMSRGIMTGITRVSKESIFSDLNNPKVVTTTSNEYATTFGFTEEEVFVALDEYGFSTEKENVKRWYDGFTFGRHTDIYNPWSILNFLDTGNYTTYWANTSSNSLVSKLIREGGKNIKQSFERLLQGESIRVPIDEQIIYNQLDNRESAIWSLLLASGYLKVVNYDRMELLENGEKVKYELVLTNGEVKKMFENMVNDWFAGAEENYNDFIKAMLMGDEDAMNEYMNRMTGEIFSYFDTGKRASTKAEPERFYHGFVLGLMVDLQRDYIITSNRESGFGRYDILLEPKKPEKNVAVIIEFKVFNSRKEKQLEDTVRAALNQIEEKAYMTSLLAKGIQEQNIYRYGFAFDGKTVLIERA